jgi:hypothetical protein
MPDVSSAADHAVLPPDDVLVRAMFASALTGHPSD